MTAVAPAHRGRGIATALKRATIVWAIEAGMRVLETGNDVENAPMRAVNATLGYRPIPDEIGLRGPLADEGTPVTGNDIRSDNLPPDPDKYDSPRAELARARGLDAPYIPGGEDPEPEIAEREDRYYGRLLVIMVVVIVTAGFVLGIIANLITGPAS